MAGLSNTLRKNSDFFIVDAILIFEEKVIIEMSVIIGMPEIYNKKLQSIQNTYLHLKYYIEKIF